METANLISQFHSIVGSTLREKQKNFNKFLRILKLTVTNQDDLNNFIQTITPSTSAEELFKINLMIEFEMKELLLEQLKACNRVLIKKLLRAFRLFRELFSNISASDLVNTILPSLSYSLRLKVLNGISKNIINEEQLDSYFPDVKKKYGMRLAVIILPGCSVELIKSNIKKYNLKLPQANLKRIFKKDKDFIDFYFNIIKQRYGTTNFSNEYLSVLKYVAKVDPNIYWKLEEKYELNIRFGKYMTPKMMKSHKRVLDEGLQIFNKFNNLKIYKTMEKENNVGNFLIRLYPDTHDEFTGTILNTAVFDFIKKGPQWQQYTLITSCFHQKYNKSLLDYPDYFTEDLLEITPLTERQNILDQKVKGNERLYYLYGTAFSIPKFKQGMQHGLRSKMMRQNVEAMLRTCFVNKDKSTLSETFNYLIHRCMNDMNLLIIIYELCLQSKYVKKLNTDHWEYLAKIQKNICSGLWNSEIFYKHYLKYLFDNNKSTDEIIKSIVENNAEGKMHSFAFVSTKKYQKLYCDKIANCIDAYKEHEAYKDLVLRFFNLVIRHCHLKKEEFLQYIRFFNQLDISDANCHYILQQAIKSNYTEAHALFWKRSNMIENHIIMWYARNRPDILQQNAHKIYDMIDEHKPGIFLHKLKRFIDEDLTEKLKVLSVNIINEENLKKKKNSIILLSVLSPEAFFELISTALPPLDGKINLEENADKIHVQRAFVDGLRYTQDTSKAFPWLLHFCIADYLKFALPSLYSVAYNTSELSLEQYLKGLYNTALSVRKHRLLLGRHLYPFDDFHKLLKSWSNTEKNLSLRNIILVKSIEYFVENPSEDLWNLIKQNLKLFNPADISIYHFLLKSVKMNIYQSEYIETVYQVIRACSDSTVRRKRLELIAAIPFGLIDKLNVKFLKLLITEMETNFYWKCVFLVDETKQLELFEESFVKLKYFAKDHKSDLRQRAYIRDKISNFLLDFVKAAIEFKKDGYLIERFMTNWHSLFQPESYSKDFILVQFTNLLFKTDFDPYQMGVRTRNLLYEYIKTYSSSIIDLFCRQLRNILSIASIENNDNDLFKFVDSFFSGEKEENLYVAVIYFLPKTLPTIENRYNKYLLILEAIQSCEFLAVRYHFNIYLSNL